MVVHLLAIFKNFAMINFTTTCDYVSFVTILTTTNYFKNVYNYFANTLQLLQVSSFHVDEFNIYFHLRTW
jgi:hypothetical protein